jgi:hypothetical protein
MCGSPGYPKSVFRRRSSPPHAPRNRVTCQNHDLKLRHPGPYLFPAFQNQPKRASPCNRREPGRRLMPFIK